DTSSMTPAVFTFTRVGRVESPLTVDYALTGTAVAGVDFEPLPGHVTLPAGATSATVALKPRANPANTNNRTATLTLTPRNDYGVGQSDRAGVTVYSQAGSLYVSTLRPLPEAATSIAY